jgi:hypothetical protein
VTEAKKFGLSTSFIEILRSEAVSGVRLAESVARGRICKVSGINIMRAAPNIHVEMPTINGIHGDLAIREDATEGATISANKVQPPPIRKTFALKS